MSCRDKLGHQEALEDLEHQDPAVLEDSRDHLDLQEELVGQVLEDHLDQLVHKDLVEKVDRQVRSIKEYITLIL